MLEQTINHAEQVQKMRSLPVVVLLVGILLSIVSFFFIKDMEDKQRLDKLSFVAKQNTYLMKARLVDSFEAVKSIAAFYAATEHVDRLEFSIFSKMILTEHPDIKALEWIPRVQAMQRHDFEQRAKREGFPDFYFTERETQGTMIEARLRDEYYPVYYIEPFKDNEDALGFDLASNSIRLQVLNKAKDTAQLQSTSRITLAQEKPENHTILIVFPIYKGGETPTTVLQRRALLLGFSLGVLQLRDILGTWLSEGHSRLVKDVMVFDSSALPDKQLLFPIDSAYQTIADIKPDTCIVIPMPVAGRVWQSVHCESEDYIDYFSDHILSTTLVMTTLFLTIFLAIYLKALVRQRVSAHQFMHRIQRSEKNLKQIMDHVGDAIITSDDSGIIRSANSSALTVFGYSSKDLMGQPMHLLMPFSKLEKHELSAQHLIDTGAAKVIGGDRFETIACRNGGNTFPIEINVTYVEHSNKRISIALIRDISILKKFELMQEAAWQRMNRFFTVTVEGLFFHKKGIITDVNVSGAAMVGMEPLNMVGHSILEFIDFAYRTVTDLKINSHSETAWESVIVNSKGSRLDVEMQGKRIEYDDVGIRLIAVRDISQRKKAEKRVKDIAASLRQLIDTANMLIFGVDLRANIHEWNRAAEQISGYKKEFVMGHSLVELFITDKNKGGMPELIKKALEGQETSNVELSLDTKKGDKIDLLLNASPSYDANGVMTGAIIVGQDITELNVSKAQIIQASKLATLGEMTTSVAHELNQPLNVMRMALGNSRRKLEKGYVDADYYLSKVNRVDDQVSRMASIVDHMRMFGRKASESFVSLDLREMVDSSFNLMSEQLRLADIEIVKDYCTCHPYVLGHQIQVEQVLLNLIGNARDAMRAQSMAQKKRLCVKVECIENNAIIRIEDSGVGLPENQIDRIFEPFFTTKETGSGTGLGLSVSYGIIKDMGGSLSAENTHAGACFTISLPLSKVALHQNKEMKDSEST